MKPLKHILVGIVGALLFLPLAQDGIRMMPEAKLQGFYQLAPKPEVGAFTWNHWFQGEFQEQFASRMEDHIGLRNYFVRIRNDYDYRLFRIPHARGFIQGKEGYLFEEDYILEYLGRYFIGESILETKLQKLKGAGEALKQVGIPLVLIIEPGKASFFPEYIPDLYDPLVKTMSNYDYVSRRITELEIPSIDLKVCFMQARDTSVYPLFPKYGMHWSVYGSALALDTMVNYIQSVIPADLPSFTFSGMELSDSPRYTDKDIADLLNLVFPLPGERLAYPVLTFDTVKPRKLNVLVVADSYFVNLVQLTAGHLFEGQEYWYYNSKIYPHIADDRNPVYVDKSNLHEKLQEFDLILLMVSEINLHCGFWNFADEVYQAFYPDYEDPPWYPYQNSILTTREWFRHVVSTAKERNVALGDAIIGNAKYMYDNKNR